MGTPVPSRGWQLLVAFGLLLALAPFLPLMEAGGDSSAFADDMASTVPLLVIAAGAVIAGLAGRQGYDVGVALGGGAVVVFSAAMAIVTWLIVSIVDAFSDLAGQSATPGPGAVAFVAATVVGVLAAVPAVRASLDRSGPQIHPLLAVGGAVGAGLYVLGVLRPSLDAGEDILTGEFWVDASLLLLLGSLVGAGILVAVTRTGAACAFLGGVLLFPAGSWLASVLEDGDTYSSGGATEVEATIGLALGLAVAVVGTFTAATRAVRPHPAGPAGGFGPGVVRVPARSTGAMAVGLTLVAMGLVAGVTEANDDDDLALSGTGWASDEAGWADDAYADDDYDGDHYAVGDGTYEEEDSSTGYSDTQADTATEYAVPSSAPAADDYTGDGCPPPDYDCADDEPSSFGAYPSTDDIPIPADVDDFASEHVVVSSGYGVDTIGTGDTVSFHFAGRLSDGTVFVDTWALDEPVTFTMGDGDLVAGFEDALYGLVEGDRAELYVGSDVGYGSTGNRDGSVPPGSDLAYLVEIVSVA